MPSPAERAAAKKKPKPPGPAGRKVVWVCRIREVRTRMKLTLRDVEAGTGLHNGHVSQIEGGAELSLSNARVIARYFAMTVEELWPRRVDGE